MSLILLWSAMAFGSTLLGSSILLSKPDWTKSNIWRVLAFASGVLLGVSFLHVLPEANQLAPRWAGVGVLAAFLLIFSIEGFTMMHSCADYAEECPVHIVSWMALGALSLHSLLDGMAIAVAFQKDPALGKTVASAILFHKFTDGLTLTGLLVSANYPVKRCFRTVAMMALATPLGAMLFYPMAHTLSMQTMGVALGFIAGVFFYIGASDILPRLHKARDYACLAMFAVGLLVGGIHWE